MTGPAALGHSITGSSRQFFKSQFPAMQSINSIKKTRMINESNEMNFFLSIEKNVDKMANKMEKSKKVLSKEKKNRALFWWLKLALCNSFLVGFF